MMLIFEGKDALAARTDPGRKDAYHASWTAYVQALAQSGIMKSGNGLQLPDTATTVRLRDGKRQVQDGPYADSKEQLGGYFILDAPYLDVALD
ncbi:MAG TPA: YciI family protein [Gaiellales bacterium]|nr:YciI family protein [Gaiellales bacterium]